MCRNTHPPLFWYGLHGFFRFAQQYVRDKLMDRYLKTVLIRVIRAFRMVKCFIPALTSLCR